MSLLINILIILGFSILALFGTLFVLIRMKERQMLKAIEKSNTPDLSINMGGMQINQLKKMIEEIDSRLTDDDDAEKLDDNLKKALLQIRSKFQNAVDQSNNES